MKQKLHPSFPLLTETVLRPFRAFDRNQHDPRRRTLNTTRRKRLLRFTRSTTGDNGLLVVRLVLLGLLEPLDERLRRGANLLVGGRLSVLLAALGAPLGNDLLLSEVLVVDLV